MWDIDVTQALRFNKFFREDAKCGVMGLRDSRSSSILFVAHTKNQQLNIASEYEFDLLMKLSFIQEITGKKILLPLEITRDAKYSINNVYSYYKNRRVSTSFNDQILTLELDPQYAMDFLDKADKDGIIKNLSYHEENATMNFCGYEFLIGAIEVKFPPMKMEHSIEELKRELSNNTNESVKITMIAAEDLPLIINPAESV